MLNLVVFASGNGSTMQSIIDSIEANELNAKINLVVSNKSDAYALERAKKSNLNTYVIKDVLDNEELENVLANYKIDLIVLAGYLRKISTNIIKNYKIINTHPSLLPKYGGKGMYGMNVHKAVVAAKEKITGVTLHYVDEQYDTGSIIKQTQVEVLPEDTPEDVATKVQKAEKIQLVEFLKKFEKEGKNNV